MNLEQLILIAKNIDQDQSLLNMPDEEKINLESKETLDDRKLNLRPRNLDKFIGQDNKSNLKTYIESSKKEK